jgi:hypothetical protein
MGVYRLGVNDMDLAIKVCKTFNSIEPDKEKVLSFLSDRKNYLLVYMIEEEIVGYADQLPGYQQSITKVK